MSASLWVMLTKRNGRKRPYAEVPKWFKGAVLKTASTGDRGVGSNPTFRARYCERRNAIYFLILEDHLSRLLCRCGGSGRHASLRILCQ